MTIARAYRKSRKRKLTFFAFVFFVVVLVAAGVAYVVSMQNIVNSGKKGELRQLLETERFKLETSVNNGIALILKMANSNKIKQYFANPANPDLEKIAFDEIADYRRALIGNTLFWVNDIDKKFYFDSTYVYTVNPETPDNYWYSLTLRETEKYNFNINYNPSIEKTDIWINAPVFGNKGKAIGMLGTGIDLAAFIESIYKNYSGNASLYFFNNSGEITGARDANLVAKKMHIGELLGKTGEKIFKSSVNLSTAEIDEFIVQDGIVAVGSVPVFDWYIVVIQHIDIRDYIKTDIIVVFVIVFMSIILFFVLFSVLS